MRWIAAMLIAIAASLPAQVSAQEAAPETTDPEKQAAELGKVAWLRNVDDAVARAKAEARPIFIQFQEVPG
jgi:hypothetical protein